MISSNAVTRRGVLGFLAAIAASPALATKTIVSKSSWKRGFDALAASGSTDPRPRYLHASAGLNDGRVVVTGGYGVSAETRGRATQAPTTSAQLYDPETDSWYDLAPMSVPRARHAAVALPDGRIAVIGGYFVGPLNSVEVYDPRTNEWTESDALPMPLVDHAVSVAGDRLIVTGGQNGLPALHLPIPASYTRLRP